MAANAAVEYTRALNYVPDLQNSLPDEIHERYLFVRRNYQLSNVGDAALDLLRRAGPPLDCLYRATAAPRCDWEDDRWGPVDDEGRLVVQPLADLALFRARCRFHLGEHAGALDDVLAAFAAARHERGLNPLLSSRREQWSIEHTAVGVAAAHLPDCAPEVVASFAGCLEALPAPSPTLAEAVLAHKGDYLELWNREALDAPDPAEVAATLEQMGCWGYWFAHVIDEVTRRDVEVLRGMIDGVGALFDEVAAILRGPPEDVEPGLDAFEARHAVTNPLELGFLENDPTRRPDVNVGLGEAMREQSFVSWARRVRRWERRRERLFAMLRAAAALVSGGPDAAPSVPDPFGAGPFAVRSVDGGFVIGEGTEDHPHGLGVGQIEGRAELDRDRMEPIEGPGFEAPIWPSDP
jgi:hypothetical protein